MLLLIISIIAVLLLVFIIYKLKHHLFLLITFILLTIIVYLLAIGLVVYLDVQELKDKSLQEPNLVLLVDEELVSALHLDLSDKQPYQAISEEKLLTMKELYGSGDLLSLRENYHKILIIYYPVIDAVPVDNFTVQGRVFTKDDAMTLLNSEDALVLYSEILAAGPGVDPVMIELNLRESGYSSTTIKADITALYTNILFSPELTSFTIHQLKEGNIEIYPSSAFFQLVDILPESLLTNVVN